MSKQQLEVLTPQDFQATCLRLHARARDVASIAPAIERLAVGRERPDEVVVEVGAAASIPPT